MTADKGTIALTAASLDIVTNYADHFAERDIILFSSRPV